MCEENEQTFVEALTDLYDNQRLRSIWLSDGYSINHIQKLLIHKEYIKVLGKVNDREIMLMINPKQIVAVNYV